MSDSGFGSVARPVRFSPFRRITEVGWGSDINVLEIDYPSDSVYTIWIDTPDISVKVGDKVDKTLVTGSGVLTKVFNLDFAERNPVGSEIAGYWKTGFFFDNPVSWDIPVIPIVDGIDPNPFHDADQHAMDIWHDWWVTQVAQMVSDNNNGFASQISDFQARHDKTRILIVSEFSEFEPTPTDGWGTRSHWYNNTDDLEYVSQVFSFLRGGEIVTETLDANLVYAFFGTNLSTATGGFAFSLQFKAKRSTLTVAQFWVPIETNKDVYLINSKLLKDTSVRISLFKPTSSSADAVNATLTYRAGASGDFVAATGRQLTTGIPKTTTTKTVAMTGEGFDVTTLAHFDGHGFVNT